MTELDPEIAAKILFQSDRTCCVCRKKGKKVQIHHIDGNHENHDEDNLAVLCLDCHGDTLLEGGFDRKLSLEQVKLYRNDWIKKVKNIRKDHGKISKKQSSVILNVNAEDTEIDSVKAKNYDYVVTNKNTKRTKISNIEAEKMASEES